jgi:hypothetical protein
MEEVSSFFEGLKLLWIRSPRNQWNYLSLPWVGQNWEKNAGSKCHSSWGKIITVRLNVILLQTIPNFLGLNDRFLGGRTIHPL